MIDQQVLSFIAAAEAGSFTKAGERLHLTTPAVMKQVNALEEKLGFRLFERNHSGIRLNKAGESLLRDAKRLVRLSQEAIEKARRDGEDLERSIKIGSSYLNPALTFLSLWYARGGDGHGWKPSIVPFLDDHRTVNDAIDALGSAYDLIFGVCDSKEWLARVGFTMLGSWRKMIAVPRTHRLAKRQQLSLDDLAGERLIMVGPGDSPVNDQIRQDLMEHQPSLEIVDSATHYDLSVFDKAVAEDCLLLNIECWADIHPALVTLPVDWSWTIPYGLMYQKDAPERVLNFVSDALSLFTNQGR